MSAVPTTSTVPIEDRNLWSTPPDLFARLDAAANADNHRCPLWLGPGGLAEDALTVPWDLARQPGDELPRVWCNPPYSRGMVPAFIQKAADEARLGRARASLLVPAWTDCPWWHELVWDPWRGRFHPGVEVEFLRGRVRFIRRDGQRGDSPTFSSMVVTFGGW